MLRSLFSGDHVWTRYHTMTCSDDSSGICYAKLLFHAFTTGAFGVIDRYVSSRMKKCEYLIHVWMC